MFGRCASRRSDVKSSLLDACAGAVGGLGPATGALPGRARPLWAPFPACSQLQKSWSSSVARVRGITRAKSQWACRSRKRRHGQASAHGGGVAIFAGPVPVRFAEEAAHMRRLAGCGRPLESGRRPGRECMPRLIHSQAGTSVFEIFASQILSKKT